MILALILVTCRSTNQNKNNSKSVWHLRRYLSNYKADWYRTDSPVAWIKGWYWYCSSSGGGGVVPGETSGLPTRETSAPRPLQTTNKPVRWSERCCWFMAPKTDIWNKTSGEFPALFVETKVDILIDTLGELPVAFLVTTLDILDKASFQFVVRTPDILSRNMIWFFVPKPDFKYSVVTT